MEFSPKHAFIQKDFSNQVVTQLKEAYRDLYAGILQKYEESLEDVNIETDNQFFSLSYKHDHLCEGLKDLQNSFLKIESALDA